jgi:hypothetical protein
MRSLRPRGRGASQEHSPALVGSRRGSGGCEGYTTQAAQGSAPARVSLRRRWSEALSAAGLPPHHQPRQRRAASAGASWHGPTPLQTNDPAL